MENKNTTPEILSEVEPVPASAPGGPVEPKKKSKRLLWVLLGLIVVVGLAAGIYHFGYYKKPVSYAPAYTPTPTKSPDVTTVKLVHTLYPSTDPPGAQNSADSPVITAGGHYIELNGKGVLTYDDKAVETNSEIHDAVLSQNGLHYAYLMSTGDPISSSSWVYIDGKQVGSVSNSNLSAVSNDGKSYLDVQDTSTITPTTYNTGIHQEIIQRDGTGSVVSSNYGFLGEQASGDLSNVLAESRNYGAGSTWYFNNQKLNNCSYTWTGDDPAAPQFQAYLSQDGLHNLCVVYYLENAPAGAPLVYEIKSLQVFEDDAQVVNITTPFMSDQVREASYTAKGQWLLFAEANAITPSGLTTLSKLYPSLTNEDLNTPYVDFTQVAYLSNTKYFVYAPYSHRLLATGVSVGTVPDLSSFGTNQVSDIDYSAASNTLFIYDTK